MGTRLFRKLAFLSREVDEIIHNLIECDSWGLGCPLGMVAEVVVLGMGWENAHIEGNQRHSCFLPSVSLDLFVPLHWGKLRA